ncbi:MAG: ABC transporter permease, partial [Treponema sp.]|nr:ABC transporter permease [Treponema sp.]
MKFRCGFFIALRYLLGRAREGGRYLRGAAAGIAVSLVPIIVTLIVADGMIRGITDRYLELGTAHIQVYNFADGGRLEKAADEISGLPGVRGVWIERQGLGMLAGKGKSGTTIRAVESSYWQDPGSARFLRTVSGQAVLESDREVLLGEEIAKTSGAEAGQTVRIMTLRTTAGGRSVPRFTPFTVKGVVSSGYRELDSLWCIITDKAGEEIFSPEFSQAHLLVKIDDPYRKAEQMVFDIYSVLGPGFSVYTWKELQRSQYSSYEQTRQLLLFIMALIVMVAAVNVSSATSMLVIERQRDIA